VVEKLEQDLESRWMTDSTPIYDFYKAHFNLDDLTDHKWYAVEEYHSNHNWKCKMVLVLLHFMVYDGYIALG
jgi:hypothetical protein